MHPVAGRVLFLAMAHWQVGEKDEARHRYQRAVERLEKQEYADRELRRFRAEAAELLGIDKQEETKRDKEAETEAAKLED